MASGDAPLEGERAHLEADIAAAVRTAKQQQEGEALADRRGDGRALHAHAEGVDKQRIQENIEHRARCNADHGEEGVALEAHLHVEHDRSQLERGAEDDIFAVADGVRQNGIRRAQQLHQRMDAQKTQRGKYEAHNDRTKEARGHGVLSVLEFLFAKQARYRVARALPQEKADGLDDVHQRKYNADTRRGRHVIELADEESIRHIVQRGDQHGDNAGDRHAHDQAVDGRFGHHLMLLFCGHDLRHKYVHPFL